MSNVVVSLIGRFKKQIKTAVDWHHAVQQHAPELVAAAYHGLLEREPDEAGLKHWIRFLRQHNRYEDLIQGFLSSPEYRRSLLEKGYVPASTLADVRPEINEDVRERRFAVLGNCQSLQVSRIIQSLTGGAFPYSEFITPTTLTKILSGHRNLHGLFKTYESIWLQPWLWEKIKPRYGEFQNQVVLYPAIAFDAFHPDLVYILRREDGGHFRGPLMDYNSSITLLGWRAGLSEKQTLQLFCREVYQRLGFFDWWDISRRTLFAEAANCGLEIESLFKGWASRGCFMHSVNHPKSYVLADVTRTLLERLGTPLRPGNPAEYVRDYLSDSNVWPIYPEIGEHLGLAGCHDYMFKVEAPGFFPDSPVRVLGLDEMIEKSYSAFAEYPEKDLVCPRLEMTAYQELLNELRQHGTKKLNSKNKTNGVDMPVTAAASHPYKKLPRYQFWRSAVEDVALDQIDPVAVQSRVTIERDTRVAAAGSCFAQHIARRLSAGGFNFLKTESAPELTEQDEGYSARYGNIYTARQLLQLMDRAYNRFDPRERAWRMTNGRYADPFRPRIETQGFESVEQLEAARSRHLAAVRTMFETLNVFIFTLGLTEAWRDKADGAIFPLAPGVAAGTMDSERYEFVNFTEAEITADMTAFIDKLLRVNPSARLILTVSPVALSASYVDRHVMVSNAYSKAVLRVAVERIIGRYACCDYFPSYEIITGAFNRGRYYAEDLRTVTAAGVDHVMRVFFQHHATIAFDRPMNPEIVKESERTMSVVCEEELLAAGIISSKLFSAGIYQG